MVFTLKFTPQTELESTKNSGWIGFSLCARQKNNDNQILPIQMTTVFVSIRSKSLFSGQLSEKSILQKMCIPLYSLELQLYISNVLDAKKIYCQIMVSDILRPHTLKFVSSTLVQNNECFIEFTRSYRTIKLLLFKKHNTVIFKVVCIDDINPHIFRSNSSYFISFFAVRGIWELSEKMTINHTWPMKSCCCGKVLVKQVKKKFR